MPDDEHALEVAGVVRTYLRSGCTLLVGAGSLKPGPTSSCKRAIDRVSSRAPGWSPPAR